MPINQHALRSKLPPYIYVVLCAFMALFFGFSIGIIYACKFDLMNRFMLDSHEVDSIFLTFLLGAVVGVFLGGRVNYDAGRRLPIVGGFLLGSIAQCSVLMSPAFSSYLISEFVLGGAFGIFIISALIYISEIAFAENRGAATISIFFSMVIGLYIAILWGRFFYLNNLSTSLFILISSLLLALISFFRLPESPRWLSISGFNDAALSELFVLRNNASFAAKELADINECGRGEDHGIALFLHSGSYRRTIWFLSILTVLIHLAGFAFFPYMSIKIISEYQMRFYALGIDVVYGSDFVKAGMTVLLLSAVTATLTVDKIGRKKLLLGSIFLTEIILVLMYFLSVFSSHFGMSLLGVLILFYIFASSIGIFVFFATLLSELLPVQGRELGVALIFFISFVCLMSSIMTFDFLSDAVGLSGFFALNLLFGAILFAILYHSLPELKGRSLESLELSYLRGN